MNLCKDKFSLWFIVYGFELLRQDGEQNDKLKTINDKPKRTFSKLTFLTVVYYGRYWNKEAI